MSVLTISAYRMSIAAVVLIGTLLALRELRGVTRLIRERPVQVAFVGLGTAAYQALYFGSVVLVGVTVATVVSLGLAPALLTIGESIRGRTLPPTSRGIVLLAALVGLVLVSASGTTSPAGDHPALGLLAAIGSGSAYALTTVLGRPLARATGPLTLTTTTTTVGALALLPLGLLGGLTGGPLGSTDPVVIGTLVYLGVLTMALAYGLLYAGLRTTTGSSAVIATLLEPVTAAGLAALFLDERLGVAGLVGAALILLAVAGLGRRPAVAAVPPA